MLRTAKQHSIKDLIFSKTMYYYQADQIPMAMNWRIRRLAMRSVHSRAHITSNQHQSLPEKCSCDLLKEKAILLPLHLLC